MAFTTDSLWLQNLAAYSAQTACIIAAAALLFPALRIRLPKARLFGWQAVLALCLALPAAEPWSSQDAKGAVTISAGAFTVLDGNSRTGRSPMPWPRAALAILCAGAVARFTFLGLGFRRLRRYRKNSALAPRAFEDLRRRMRVSAEFRVAAGAAGAAGPVTFGLRRPVVLLPPGWLDNEAVACHELIHVRRGDWVYTVAEEFIRALLWFHPGIWWAIGQIHAAREEVVDRAALEIVGNRERYLEALLAVAAARAGLDLLPASPFFEKRHLRQRVASLLKEVSMSRLRLTSSLAVLVPAVVFAGWLAIRSFPLQAAPAADAPGVTVEQDGPALLHRDPVRYPSAALAAHVQGKVTADLTLAPNGTVLDAQIVSGAEELRKAVLESVLGWHFAPDAQLPHKVKVAVDFRLPEPGKAGPDGTAPHALPPPPLNVVRRIGYRMPDDLRRRLESRVTLREGDELTQTAMDNAFAAAAAIDEHIALTFRPAPDKSGSLLIFALANYTGDQPGAPQRIRVGGNLQAANLIHKETPVYPPAAKAARIQGTVRFTVVIGKDGRIQDLQLVSGHPLLVEAAQAAVWNWVYKPTLLNGEPVEVVTAIDVNFTLLP